MGADLLPACGAHGLWPRSSTFARTDKYDLSALEKRAKQVPASCELPGHRLPFVVRRGGAVVNHCCPPVACPPTFKNAIPVRGMVMTTRGWYRSAVGVFLVLAMAASAAAQSAPEPVDQDAVQMIREQGLENSQVMDYLS